MENQFPQFDIHREFEPHLLLRGGHFQTLAGNCLPGWQYSSKALVHRVKFPDGDVVALHDDCPLGWKETDLTALLLHGLAGTSQSGYMQRVAGKLVDRGVRVFRMDLRGCGAGSGLARLPYHPGRSQDGLWALNYVADLCPRSPLAMVGFSLGANLGLKMLGEFRHNLPANLRRAIAVNPPLDLERSVNALERFFTRIYNSHFVKCLLSQVKASKKLLRRNAVLKQGKRWRKMREFDDFYTRDVWGFSSVSEFYSDGSATPWLKEIRVPTLILAAEDDPIVPHEIFHKTPRSPQVRLHVTETGGHLGFVSRRGVDDDRRWMEWRVVDWVTAEEPRAALPRVA